MNNMAKVLGVGKWLVVLAIAGCGGSAADMRGAAGAPSSGGSSTATAGGGNAAGANIAIAGAGGTESAAGGAPTTAGAPQGGEPGEAGAPSTAAGATSSDGGAAQGGQSAVAGAGGAAGTSAGAGGAAAGAQGGSENGGASTGGASGQGGANAAGMSGGGAAGAPGSAGAGGAVTCECSTGQCCDGCHLRPSSYKLTMAIFRTGCAGPGGSVLVVDTRPLNCTGASATEVAWGNYNDIETTPKVCPSGYCWAPCAVSGTCGQGYPPKATPDPALLAYCQ